MSGLLFSGLTRWEHCDVDGTVLDTWRARNGIITASIDALLDAYFSAGSGATWYLGLINSTSFSALSASDSMSSHAGWLELTDYSESARPAWGPGNSASGVKTNSAAVVFTASSAIIVEGFFVTSNSTKGGTTGTLWAHGTFTNERTVQSGQTLRAYYEIRGRQG